jgi:hypothetical protein
MADSHAFRIVLSSRNDNFGAQRQRALYWPEGGKVRVLRERGLVVAARMNRRQDHQVRMREQPLFDLDARGFRGVYQSPEMLIPGERLEVIEADTREAGDFIRRKELLARPDSNHLCTSR